MSAELLAMMVGGAPKMTTGELFTKYRKDRAPEGRAMASGFANAGYGQSQPTDLRQVRGPGAGAVQGPTQGSAPQMGQPMQAPQMGQMPMPQMPQMPQMRQTGAGLGQGAIQNLGGPPPTGMAPLALPQLEFNPFNIEPRRQVRANLGMGTIRGGRG